MRYSDLSLPVPYRDTFDVLDSSKIQAFMDSPRRFLYEYIFGWRPEDPNVHLVFGSAWHEAMEYLMHHIGEYRDSKVILQAYELFEETYRKEFPDPFGDLTNGVKTPDNALAALAQYCKYWEKDDFETLWTEVAGTIPINDEKLIYWKLDTIIRVHPGSHNARLGSRPGIQSLEHKTAGMLSSAWKAKWDVLVQPWTYTHALRGLYGDEAVGININGSIIRSKTNEFIRIPVAKTPGMMNAGLFQVNHFVAQLDWNMRQLEQCSDSDDVLLAFPCNGYSCSKSYSPCPFNHFCAHVPNPLQKFEPSRPPLGFVEEFWDPRRELLEGAKKIVHIENMAMEETDGDAKVSN